MDLSLTKNISTLPNYNFEPDFDRSGKTFYLVTICKESATLAGKVTFRFHSSSIDKTVEVAATQIKKLVKEVTTLQALNYKRLPLIYSVKGALEDGTILSIEIKGLEKGHQGFPIDGRDPKYLYLLKNIDRDSDKTPELCYATCFKAALKAKDDWHKKLLLLIPDVRVFSTSMRTKESVHFHFHEDPFLLRKQDEIDFTKLQPDFSMWVAGLIIDLSFSIDYM